MKRFWKQAKDLLIEAYTAPSFIVFNALWISAMILLSLTGNKIHAFSAAWFFLLALLSVPGTLIHLRMPAIKLTVTKFYEHESFPGRPVEMTITRKRSRAIEDAVDLERALDHQMAERGFYPVRRDTV